MIKNLYVLFPLTELAISSKNMIQNRFGTTIVQEVESLQGIIEDLEEEVSTTDSGLDLREGSKELILEIIELMKEWEKVTTIQINTRGQGEVKIRNSRIEGKRIVRKVSSEALLRRKYALTLRKVKTVTELMEGLDLALEIEGKINLQAWNGQMSIIMKMIEKIPEEQMKELKLKALKLMKKKESIILSS